MAKAVFYQKGNILDYLNSSESLIGAGDVVAMGTTKITVAANNILPGETGGLVNNGVFILPKASSITVNMGDPVYFNLSSGNITKTSTDVPAGIAVAAAGSSDANVYVDISSGAAAAAAAAAGAAAAG